MLPNWLYGKSLRKLQEILNSGGQTAAGVSYSNTESGLEATNAQAAIDEVVEELDTKAAQSAVTEALSAKVAWSDYTKLGAVNLLNFNPATATQGETTFTRNSDGTYTVVATEATASPRNVSANISLPAGSYKLTGTPSNGSAICRMTVYSNTEIRNLAIDEGSGSEFTITQTHQCSVYIDLRTGVPAGTYVFKPMIAPVDYNGPYIPYAKTNKELTDELAIGAVSATANTDYLNGTNNAIFRKYGKMVSCEGYFQVTTAAARTAVLYTLAELPLGSSFLLALKNTGDYVLLNAKSDGTIIVESEGGIAAGFYSLIGTFVLP